MSAAMAACTASTYLLLAMPPNARNHSVLSNGRSMMGLRGRFRGVPVRIFPGKSGKLRFGPAPLRAATPEETPNDISEQFDKVLGELNEKWDSVENKSAVFIYGAGALAALWFSSTVLRAINSFPLSFVNSQLPKLMEAIGIVYTVWFAYRYLLFKENRRELAADIEELKRKITGSEDD